MVPAYAEPDIHSLSRALAGRHRRLSLCSLPVLKQSEGSLGSLTSVAYSVRCRTWQPARSVILMLFLFVGSVFRPPPRCTLLQVQSLVVLDPPPSDMQPSCAQQQGLLDSRSLSSFRFHRPAPNRDRIGAPALPLPLGSSGYACCVVEKVGCAPPSPLISFRPRKARSN